MGSRLDGADRHSSISCSFTTLFQYWSRTHKVAVLLSLPTKHLLKNPFLPYDSLDSSDGVQYRRLLQQNPSEGGRRKHIPYVSGNLLRPTHDHIRKEDCHLG